MAIQKILWNICSSAEGFQAVALNKTLCIARLAHWTLNFSPVKMELFETQTCSRDGEKRLKLHYK
jgi:hypothetical protein